MMHLPLYYLETRRKKKKYFNVKCNIIIGVFNFVFNFNTLTYNVQNLLRLVLLQRDLLN